MELLKYWLLKIGDCYQRKLIKNKTQFITVTKPCKLPKVPILLV